MKKDQIAHATCWPSDEQRPEGTDWGQDWTDFSAEVPDLFPEDGPIVYGKRNHEKKCESCWLIHAGECG